MGYPRTAPKVLEALTYRQGRDVGIQELQAATGLSEKQIQNAMRSLIDRDGRAITVVQRGTMWKLNNPTVVPPRPSTDALFKVVGRASDGSPIVRGDQSGTLYRLTAL